MKLPRAEWPPHIVVITWEDAHMSHDDSDVDSVSVTCTRRTAGFLVARKERHVVVAQDIGEDAGQFRNYMAIPIRMITECKELR